MEQDTVQQNHDALTRTAEELRTLVHIKEEMERTLCGIEGRLPEGDVYFMGGSAGALSATCPKCKQGHIPRGTPLSQMTSQRFCEIAASWGYP